jgi:poly-beta-1,6-N-acetyl-D-glucosamine synthase
MVSPNATCHTIMNVIPVFGILYVGIMAMYALGFIQKRRRQKREAYSHSSNLTPFSVIVPFKDEIHCLPILIQSMKEQTWPEGCEIIFVNDHSQDGSEQVLLKHTGHTLPAPYRVLMAKEQGKKGALNTGIHDALNEWIVTVDADVVLPHTWASTIGSFLNHTNASMVCMPVKLTLNGGRWGVFQQLESAALVGMSIGAPQMGHVLTANGANLAFTRTLFKTLNGYHPEQHPGGDDEFLLLRAYAYQPDSIDYLAKQEVCVTTTAVTDVNTLVLQRHRWASKMRWKTWNKRQVMVLIPSLFMAVLFLTMGSICWGESLDNTYVLLTYKWAGDGILFVAIRRFFNLEWKRVGWLLFMPFYQIMYMLPVLYRLIFHKPIIWKNNTYGYR